MMQTKGNPIPLLLVLALALSTAGTNTNASAEGTYTLRIASLAPAGSSWMKILNAWNAALQERTDGRLRLQFYPGGSQGDERDVVRKMRIGQLDGGLVTMTGMSLLIPAMNVLVLPGLLDTYEELDRVRHRMAPRFEDMFQRAGFAMVGWADAGKTRLFSAKPIRKPSDIKAMRPWAWKDDPIFVEFYKVIGANAVRLGVPEVYGALQTRMVDVISSSALTAIAFQWHTRVSFVTAHNSAIIAGGTMMRKQKLDELPLELREEFERTASQAHALLNRTIRNDDRRAYEVILKRGIRPIEAGEAQHEWDAADKAVRDSLAGRLLSKSLVEAVAEAAVP